MRYDHKFKASKIFLRISLEKPRKNGSKCVVFSYIACQIYLFITRLLDYDMYVQVRNSTTINHPISDFGLIVKYIWDEKIVPL